MQGTTNKLEGWRKYLSIIVDTGGGFRWSDIRRRNKEKGWMRSGGSTATSATHRRILQLTDGGFGGGGVATERFGGERRRRFVSLFSTFF